MNDWKFTFGHGHNLFPGFVRVTAPDHGSARAVMVKKYGDKWAFQYEPGKEIHPMDNFEKDHLTVIKFDLPEEWMSNIECGCGSSLYEVELVPFELTLVCDNCGKRMPLRMYSKHMYVLLNFDITEVLSDDYKSVVAGVFPTHYAAYAHAHAQGWPLLDFPEVYGHGDRPQPPAGPVWINENETLMIRKEAMDMRFVKSFMTEGKVG